MIQKQGGMKEVWQISYPLIISMASYTIMQFFNRVFLAWYSSDALAACVPAGALSFSFICFFMGVCMYTNVFVAQFYGSRRFANLTVSLWQGVWIAIASGFVIATLVPLGYYIINMSHHSGAVKVLERKYFLITTLFGGVVPATYALSSFFTGQGKTKITMRVNALGNAVNIILSYLLIFGVGIFPELGISGAAISFVAGHLVMIIAFLLIIFSRHNRKIFRTDRLLSFHPRLLLRILKYGAPNGVGFFIDISSFTVFIFLAGSLGKVALAANNIIFALISVAFMPILGMGMGVLTLTGQYIGRKNYSSAVRAVFNGFKLAGGYVFILSALFIFLPGIFIKIFGAGGSADLPVILALTYKLIKILPLFILCDMTQVIFADAIKGAGDTRFQMITALVCAWGLFVPGTFIIIKTTGKIEHIFLWACFYLFCMGLTFLLRFKSNKWQKIRLY